MDNRLQDAPDASPVRLWIIFLAFVVGLAGVLAFFWPRLDPEPVYRILSEDPKDPFIEFSAETPLSFEFDVPQPDVDGVYMRVLYGDINHRILARARNLSTGEWIGESEAGFGLEAWLPLTQIPQQGQRLRVELSILESPAGLPGMLKRSKYEPSTPFAMEEGSEHWDDRPLMLLHFRKPSRDVVTWLWLVPMAGFLAALRWPALTGPVLIVTGMLAVSTSLLGWQQRYANHMMHQDPDRYGLYAETLARYVTEPAAREEATQWFANYEHAYVALVPAVLSLFIMAGFSMNLAYAVLSALCTFGALLLLYHLVRRQLGLSLALALGSSLLLACHFTTLRSFARPTTDQAGLILIVWLLSLLVDRCQREHRGQYLSLSVLVFCLGMVRPPGPAYAGMAVGLFVLCDAIRLGCITGFAPSRWRSLVLAGLAILTVVAFALWVDREKQRQHPFDEVMFSIVILAALVVVSWIRLPKVLAYFKPPSRLVATLVAGGLPILLLAALWLSFGWWDNFLLAQKKSLNFAVQWKPYWFMTVSFVVVQGLFLPWLVIPWRKQARGIGMILVAWIILHTALLVAVRAPFIDRLFLPVVPAIIILAAMGLRRVETAWKLPWLANAFFILVMAANVFAMMYLVHLPGPPPRPWDHILYY